MSDTSKPRMSVSLAAGSSAYLAANFFTALLSLALLPVLTRHLSPAEYGEAAMFLTVVSLCNGVVGLNGNAASARRHFDNLPPIEFAALMGACVQIVAASALLLLAFLVHYRQSLSALLGLGTTWLVWAVVVSACAVLVQLIQAQWQVRGAFKAAAVQQISEALVVTLLSLLLVVVFKQGGSGRISAIILTSALFAVLAILLMYRMNLLRVGTWRPQHVRYVLDFGLPLVPHVVAAYVLTAADRIVVTAELGMTQAGIYMLAAHIAQVPALVFDGVNKAYAPWLFQRLESCPPNEKRQIVRYTYAWFSILFLGGWLSFYIGPLAVRFVAGESFDAAGSVIGWLLLGQMFAGMYLMVTNYVFYAKRTGLLAVVTVACALLNVLLLLVLVPDFGIVGAAMAFCLCMGLRFLLTWWIAHRSYPMPWFILHPRELR